MVTLPLPPLALNAQVPTAEQAHSVSDMLRERSAVPAHVQQVTTWGLLCAGEWCSVACRLRSMPAVQHAGLSNGCVGAGRLEYFSCVTTSSPRQVLAALPSDTHPMAQLCTAVLALQVGCCRGLCLHAGTGRFARQVEKPAGPVA